LRASTVPLRAIAVLCLALFRIPRRRACLWRIWGLASFVPRVRSDWRLPGSAESPSKRDGSSPAALRAAPLRSLWSCRGFLQVVKPCRCRRKKRNLSRDQRAGRGAVRASRCGSAAWKQERFPLSPRAGCRRLLSGAALLHLSRIFAAPCAALGGLLERSATVRSAAARNPYSVPRRKQRVFSQFLVEGCVGSPMVRVLPYATSMQRSLELGGG